MLESDPLTPLPEEEIQLEARFPIESLPVTMRDFVAEVAKVHQLPAEIPASMALAVVSAVMGQAVVLANPPHETPPNLYFLLTAASGTGKSAAFSKVTKPLFELQSRLMADHAKGQVPRLLAEKHLLTSEIQQTKKTKSLDPAGRAEALHGLEVAMGRLAEIDADLLPPRIVCEDATGPKLASLLATNQESMAVFTSEGGDVVSTILGRHNGTGRTDETLFLKGFSRDPHNPERVGTGSTVLNSPCLAVLLVMTPDEATELFNLERFRVGGLLPRFLICSPEVRWEREEGESRIPDAVKVEGWEKLVVDLAECFRLKAGDAVSVEADPSALELLRAYANDYADRYDELKEQAAFASRHVELAARMALVLHCTEHGRNAGKVMLSQTTVERAWSLLEYFRGQQEKMLVEGITKAREDRLEKLLTSLSRYENGQTTLAELRKRNGWDKKEVERLARLFPKSLTLLHLESPSGGRPSTLISSMN